MPWDTFANPVVSRRWRLFGLAVALATVAVAVMLVLFAAQLPDTSSLTHYQPKQPLRVLTADGVEIGGFGAERRVVQRIDQIPDLMKKSLLAVEDTRFYTHQGVDPIGLARALTTFSLTQRMHGGSTITQQVARTFFLDRSRTLERKIKEAMLAFKIERQLSKDQILELYMNEIYLGGRAYGFEAASQAYFGKTLAALGPAECAMLAGLPQNPYFANPVRNLSRAMVRQRHALSRMRSQGVITEQQYAQAMAEQLVIRRPGAADVHAEYAAEMVRQQVYAQYGELAYTTGLNVTTTLRAAEQQAAYKALRHTLIEHSLRQPWRGPESQENLAQEWADADPRVARALGEFEDDDDLRLAVVTRAAPKAVTAVLASGEVVQISGVGLRAVQGALATKATAALRIQRGSVVRVVLQGKSWTLAQWPQAEGALVALDPQTGDMRALVGGFDFYRNQFNHVTQGWRQPGSSYKPFIYSGAIESGVQPDTLINDAPMENVGNWAPENDDGSTDGPITLRSALARSKNLVSIRLMQLLSPKGAREWTSRFGFDPERQPDDLTQALGSGATNPLQMAGAYAVLANGGLRVTPRLVTRIARAGGEVVFESADLPLDEAQRVIPARNAFVVSSLLQEVTRSGTAARAQATLKRSDLYGKTGTTNDVVDAWFGGFQPGLVAVVWVGFDTPRSLGSRASGSALALPAWIEFMATALKDVPVQEVLPPDGLVQVDGEWRYAEWAEGGFVRSLGLDGDAITPALAVRPSMPVDAVAPDGTALPQ